MFLAIQDPHTYENSDGIIIINTFGELHEVYIRDNDIGAISIQDTTESERVFNVYYNGDVLDEDDVRKLKFGPETFISCDFTYIDCTSQEMDGHMDSIILKMASKIMDRKLVKTE